MDLVTQNLTKMDRREGKKGVDAFMKCLSISVNGIEYMVDCEDGIY